MRFWIDVEDASGVKQGSGPIAAALHWRSVKRLDRAGEFSFEMPATDSRASLVTSRRVARCYAIINGAVAEVGAGTIDSVSVRIPEDGQPLLVVGGPDLLGELRRPTLDLRGGSWPTFDEVDDAPYDMLHDWANVKLSSAWALADEAGSTIGSGAAVTGTDVYAKFVHESVLAGLISVAQATGEHLRLGTGRVVEWVNSWTDSGIHAVYGAPSPVAVESRTEIAQIAGIEKITDSQDIVNRVFLYGAGEGHNRMDLTAVDMWPDGTAIGAGSGPFSRTIDGVLYYLVKDTTTATIDNSFYCLQDNASDTTYGANEMALAFKNIAPISNTAADVTAAANQLLRSGFEWLKTRSNPQAFYRLALAGVQGEVKVGETVQVTARRYVDGQAAINIDAALNVLEATTEVSNDGLRTVAMVVSTTERQPNDDSSVVVDRLAEAVVSQAHQQTGPAGWTENHIDWMDDTTGADFYFWLGEEIVQVQQIMLRFRVDELRSNVKTTAEESAHTHGVIVYGVNDPSTDPDTLSRIVYNNAGDNKFYAAFGSGSNETATTETGSAHAHAQDYGIYTESSANTYGHSGGNATVAQIQNDIDILVGGSDRSASIVAESASGWFKLDVTDWLIDSATLRPSSADNLISFIKASGGAANKTAQITFKLQVRCSMQSVNYS